MADFFDGLSGLGTGFLDGLLGGTTVTPQASTQTFGFGQDNILDATPGINTDAVIGKDLAGNVGTFNLGDKNLASGSAITGVGPTGKLFGGDINGGQVTPGNTGSGSPFNQENYWGKIGKGLGGIFTPENAMKFLALKEAKETNKRNFNAYATQANNTNAEKNAQQKRRKNLSASMYGTADQGVTSPDLKDIDYV